MERTSVEVEPARNAWRKRGRTTIELRQNGRGEWLATQRGVEVSGRGQTAAAAAAAYCRAVNAGSDRRDADG